METDTTKLAFALVLTFVLPMVGYLTGMAWNRTVGAPPKVNKVWATFCLAAPIVGLLMFVKIDFDLIRRLWSGSPYVLSVCVVAFGIVAPAALVAAIARLWRTRPSQPEH